MLTPMQFSILTLEDAKTLKDFIEKSTATPSTPKNYKKIGEAGMLPIYHQLENFLEMSAKYENDLRYFDPGDFVRV